MKLALFYIVLTIGTSTILLSYWNMKENIKLLTPKVKVLKQNIEMKSYDELKIYYEELHKKIIAIIFFNILLISSLHYANYPTPQQPLDYQSLEFYLGLFYMVNLNMFLNFSAELGRN